MQLPKAELEHWMREFYFTCPIDLGSSGVATYSFEEVKHIAGISNEELEAIKFDDSFTRGSDGLRQAIADQWGDGNANRVMTSNGSNEMLYHIMSTMLQADDEIVLLDPIYHALSTVAETAGCNVKRWVLDPGKNFVPDIEDLRRLVSPRTKMVAVNFPHNPTGVTITRNQLDDLLHLVRENDAYLIWDAAFEEMTLDQRLPNPSLIYDKAISVGTLSKGYGLPGLRVGWCFAPQQVIDSCIQLRDYTTLYISPLIELIAQKAIENAPMLLGPKMADANANLQKLRGWVLENDSLVQWTNPRGGVSCLVKICHVEDTEEFCRELAHATGVMLVPGECFGQKGHVRLGFGSSVDEFSRGIELVDAFLKKKLGLLQSACSA